MKSLTLHAARISTLAVTCLLLGACQPGASAQEAAIWLPEVVDTYPHDSNAFTQGLLFHDGDLYESTGLRGQSTLRQVDLETGRVLRRHDLDRRLFAEGLELVGDRLYQLTWQAGIVFVYTLEDFREVASFRYDGEGWGLAWDGEHLIMSDGTPTLRFMNPDDFSVDRTITVTNNGTPQIYINELEYIDDEVWANIWMSDLIARIDPESGRIVGWIDMREVYPAEQRDSDAVVNGIAWDPETDRIFMTGKLWPAIFEVRFSER